MRTRYSTLLLGPVLVACAFEPRGSDDSELDADPGDDGALIDADPGDDGAPIDAATIDAAAIDARIIDAPAIDAPAIDAPPPTCPTSYDVTAGASKYRFVTNPQPFNNASGDCANDGIGTHLATFEVAADIETVHTGRGGSEQFWVAAVCTSVSQTECSMTASWRWQGSTQTVTASLWAGGEPNNPAIEHNAVSVKDSGSWRLNNVRAAEVHAYLCECGD